MENLVSVVIPNYNGEAYLVACLESVLIQDYANIEIIVVDDGSTDDSLKILLSYRDRIQVISIEHQGASAARNIGISSAKGRFIALLDSDDIWEQNKLDQQMEKMINGNYDLIYCSGRELYSNETSGVVITAQYSGNCYKYFKQFPARAVIVLGCSSALMRASLLKDSGLFDVSFSGAAEDWDFFRRYCRNAKVGFVPEILVRYRKHNTSTSARPTLDWYSGNTKAILKMFNDDSKIGFFQKRFIWTKFQYSALKTFTKRKEAHSAFRALIRLLSAIRIS